MSSMEEYVRQTQLPESGRPRTKIMAATKSSLTRTAKGGPASIRPKGQTPFDPIVTAADTVEEVPEIGDTQDQIEIPAEDVTGESPGFPQITETPDMSRLFGSGGGAPDVTGGTNPDGTFNGTPPRGGHESVIIVGGGQGSGSGGGVVGRLYVAGQQENGEFGIGTAGAASVTPPQIVPGIPKMRNVGSGPRATYAVGEDGLMHVAGEGVQNPETIIPPAVPTQGGSFSDTSRYVHAGRAEAASPPQILSATDSTAAIGTGPVSSSLYTEPVSSDFALSFRLSHPTKISSIVVRTAQISSGADAKYAPSVAVRASIFRGSLEAFKAGASEKVGEMVFISATPSQPVFRSETGDEILLPEGDYVVAVSWQGSQFKTRSYNINSNFTGASLKFDGTVWTEVGMNSSPGRPTSLDFSIEASRAGALDVRRIESSGLPFGMSAPPAGKVMAGVRLQLRGVFNKEKISVYLRDAIRGPVGTSSIIAQGFATVDPENFPAGLGTADVLFDQTWDGVTTDQIDLVIETFGASYEVAFNATNVANKAPRIITSDGARIIMSGSLSARGLLLDAEGAAPVTAYGRNMGLSVAEQVLSDFVLSNETSFLTNVDFSEAGLISATLTGAVAGDRTTGETPVADTDLWSLFTHETDTLAKTQPQLVALDQSDGSSLWTRFGQLYGVGVSTSGRLGFSGTAADLRAANAPQLSNSRGVLSPLNGVIRASDGRLFGAGQALFGGWNAIPQLGIPAASNPTSSSVFNIISEKVFTENAFDLGGDDSFSFLLASDADGLWASGRLDGVFQLDALTNIHAARQFRWIRAGYKHALLLTAEGDLYGIGSNSHGQLGLPLSTALVTVPTFIAGGIARAFATMNKTFILAA